MSNERGEGGAPSAEQGERERDKRGEQRGGAPSAEQGKGESAEQGEREQGEREQGEREQGEREQGERERDERDDVTSGTSGRGTSGPKGTAPSHERGKEPMPRRSATQEGDTKREMPCGNNREGAKQGGTKRIRNSEAMSSVTESDSQKRQDQAQWYSAAATKCGAMRAGTEWCR